MNMTGTGKQVNTTVINKKGFLPYISLRYPISGLIKKERVPYYDETFVSNLINDFFT